jgi:sodium/proline symporter
VPALAIGLNWENATREGAIASIATALVFTLLFETLGYFKIYTVPAGITISGASLVLSFLVFFTVSWLTRARAPGQLDPDVRLIMES